MAVQQVIKQISLVLNFREEFEELKNRFPQINSFLNEADEDRSRQRQRESLINWLKNVRDLAWRAENILEECAVESMYANITYSYTLGFNRLIFRNRMGRRIKKVKARVSSIVKEGDELRIFHALVPRVEAGESSTHRSAQVKKSALLPRDSHPLGIESKVQHMVSLLEDLKAQVIAVVGMGGSGKTFLLQNVYNSLKSGYKHSIWLSISKSYSLKNLQRDIASYIDLKGQIVEAEVTEQRAAELIHGRLQGKKSLIVLDDLWTFSTEDNLMDKLGLPAEKDCKVVVSTRNREVARMSKAHIYEMKNLSDEESWRLFCAYAFQEPQQHLEELGRQIVKQCGNLPLAIKTTAASLAKSTTAEDWELKLRQLKGVVSANVDHDPVMPVLRLSYDSLPAHLKACFAYLSFSPEDEEIECEYLINLWIGEGFIESEREVEAQQKVAWGCLYQLANLCLLELSEKVFFNLARYLENLTKCCKIHDRLHDLAIHISRENRCAFYVEEASTPTNVGTGWGWILLAKKDIHVNAISESRPVCLRTLSLSENWKIWSIPADFFTAMRGLRVLDLSGTRISTLPKSVGKMKLLKVLNLRSTPIWEVPECV